MERTEVVVSGGDVFRTKRDHGKANGFTWGKGTLAISLFFVRYALFLRSSRPDADFEFSGFENSPAATLGNMFGKLNGLSWVADMFGTGNQTLSNLFWWTDRINAAGKDKARPRLIKFKDGLLGTEQVKIHSGKIELTDETSLLDLIHGLEKQWKGQPNVHTSPPRQCSHVCAEKAEAIVAPSTSGVFSGAKPIEVQTGGRSSEDWITQLDATPAEALKKHLVAATAPERGNDAVCAAVSEVLEPEALNILTERLVHAPLCVFTDFFLADLDSPPRIKQSIARVIGADSQLTETLARKVAQSEIADMLSWFQAFSFFSLRQTVIKVEHYFCAECANKMPPSGLAFTSPHMLENLIGHFERFGCVAAVHELRKIVPI